jgi:tetratricopeptide (TPR) repeat protein
MMKQSPIGALFAAAGLGVVLVASAALAQHQDHKPARLGTVEFKVDCADAAQKEFNRAMALYHSFAWSDATAAFESIARIDPKCGMAHWGRAMTMLDNPFVWPANVPGPVLDKAAAALEEAKKAGLRTDRERAYVEATLVFVRDHATRDHRTRVKAFEEELGKVAAAYPDDKEASILYALVTSANFDPKDRTYANQRRAAQILEPLFAANPDHPGVAHYLIHTYDYPPIAQEGLAAAQRYAEIAPDAPHALHMPSHIFTRVGYWKESIASNRASAKAAGDASFDAHHAFDYMVYAHLQLAQDGNAKTAMEESLSMKPIDHFAAAFAYAAMPARLALEREDWTAASRIALKPGADSYPWQKYPHAEAINAFARGVGAARSGDAMAAREQQKRLLALRDASKIPYWADQMDIQAEVVGALALCADGKQAECTEALRKVAAREDATEKHVVTPGPLLPARELLGDALLTQGKAAEALQEYETVLVKEPNRYRAIAGAMAAARQAGDDNKARSYAERLLKQAEEAEPGTRASLMEARQLASKR